MLQILKKQPDSAKSAVFKAWHPDFRHAASLPDTKVIRTSFYINAIAGALALLLVGLTVQQEIAISEKNTELTTTKAEIAKYTVTNAASVVLYKEFQEIEQRVLEVDRFFNTGRVPFAKVVADFAESLDIGMAITTVDYTEQGVSIKGFAMGSPEQGNAVVSSYGKKVRVFPAFVGKFDRVIVANPTPDKLGARVTFDLSMKVAAPVPAKK